MKLILFLITIFCFYSCNSSNTSENKNDLNEASNLIIKYNDSIYANPEKTFDVFTKAQRGITDSSAYYKLELFKAMCRVFGGNTDDGIRIQRKVKAFISRNPNAHEIEGTYWNHRAITEHTFLGKNDSTIYFYKKGYEAFCKIPNRELLINVCINIADTYKDEGNFAETAKYYQKALFISDSTKNATSLLAIYTGLGQVYAELKNYDKADKYFKDASAYLKNATPYENFYYYNSLGNNLYYRKRYSQALKSFNKGYEIVQTFHSPDLNAMVECNIGEVYMLMGEIAKSEEFLNKASTFYTKNVNANPDEKFYYNSLMAQLFLTKHRPQDMHRHISDIKDINKIRPRYKALYYRRLEEYCLTQNNYTDAYNFRLKAQKIEDSISNTLIKSQISEITYRYAQDTTLLHRNLTITTHERKINELWWMIAILGLAFGIIILSIAFFYQARKRNTELRELKMKASLQSLRMANIRNRISPHFIFNVLNRELAATNQGINNLVLLLRKNLELCDKYCITLQEEIEFVDTYIATETAAIGNDFHYTKNIAENVDLSKSLIPSMMIQIFVENAIKHGLRGYEGEKLLFLNISKSDSATTIEILNNGNIFSENAAGNSTHTGIKVIMQTIQILNDGNNNKIDIKIGSKPFEDGSKGWDVVMKIPDNYNFYII